MMDMAQKKRLKAVLIEALLGKLPIKDGPFRIEAANIVDPKDTHALLKVRDLDGNLEMYIEVKAKEVY